MASTEIYTAEEQRRIDELGRVAREQQEYVRRQGARQQHADPVPEQTEEDLLLPDELEILWACEDEIRHGMAAYLRVAEALHTIQTKRLYREDFSTFGAYCAEKWNLTDRHARNMANAWEIALDLDSDPIANADQLPANERQARELKQVPKERRAEVWEAAVAEAGGVQHVCAHDVKTARERLIEAAPTSDRSQPSGDSGGQSFPEGPRVVETEAVVTVTNQDPRNHAMRIINKHSASYAMELANEILALLAEKGII